MAQAGLDAVNAKLAEVEWGIIRRGLPNWKKALGVGYELSVLPKGLGAGGEGSWLERQGFGALFSRPIMTIRQYLKTVPTVLSEAPPAKPGSDDFAPFSGVSPYHRDCHGSGPLVSRSMSCRAYVFRRASR